MKIEHAKPDRLAWYKHLEPGYWADRIHFGEYYYIPCRIVKVNRKTIKIWLKMREYEHQDETERIINVDPRNLSHWKSIEIEGTYDYSTYPQYWKYEGIPVDEWWTSYLAQSAS